MSKMYKKLSSHGSINIPVAMRRALGLEPKDPMILEEEKGKVIISPYIPRCIFCKTTEEVQVFHGKGICCTCAGEIAESLGGN